MIKLLIFDLDGTIADTIPAIMNALNITLKNHNFPETNYENVRKAVGNGTRPMIKLVFPEGISEDFISEMVVEYENAYAHTYLDTNVAYDGFYETIEELQKRGYEMAVCTNKSDAFVVPLINQLLPKDSVKLCVGRKDGVPRKPDPSVPLMIADYFGFTPAECAFIGDSDVDYMTGKNSGMNCVSVTWGYRTKEQLKELGSTVFAEKPEDLLDLFR